MKKVILALALVSFAFAACNNEGDSKTEAATTDSPKVETPKVDSPAVAAPVVDTMKKVVDTLKK